MALMATVFLGAITDNIFRIVVALFATRLAADAGDSTSLALGSALFVVPYLLFSGYAGYIADRFDKRWVLIIVKSMEILAMALGYVALMSGRMDLMLAVIFLTALQSALFAPAHYGILPEILPESAISRANGLDQLCTFIAIVIGSAAGGAMSDAWGNDVPWIGGMLMVIAVIGSLTSLWISRGATPISQRPFPKWPWGEMVTGIRRLYRVRPLWLTVLGISYFWFLGALLQLGNMLLGEQILGLSDTEIGLMNVAVAVGIAFGSIAAGRLSGDHVEFGLVPLGSIGIGIGALLLAAAPPSYTMTLIALAVIGFSAGLFIVPLNAFLQLRAGADERGRLIAANNFLNMFGVMLAAGVLWLLSNGLHLAADEIVLVIGLTTFAATVYVLIQLGDFFVRFLLWLLTHSIYRITPGGRREHAAQGPGPAGQQPCLLRRRAVDRRQPAALRALHHVSRLLRPAGAELAVPGDARDPHQRRQSQADQRGLRPRPRGAEAGPCGLHLRRGRAEPLRQSAAVPARRGADPRRHRRARHPGASGPGLGQHLQLQGRQVLLEMAAARAVCRSPCRSARR